MRLVILILSVASVIFYGYALGGYAAHTFGRDRPEYIAWGLGMGTLSGGAALLLWKKWTKETTPDILIFDVDGVLIDTSGSYMRATAETVRWCWKNLLGGEADCEGYGPELFEISKAHPSFNDDAAVTWALLRFMARTGAKSMREALPSPAAWREELKAFDGAVVEDAARREADGVSFDRIRDVLLGFYFGEGGESSGGKGFWTMDKPGILRHWRDLGLPVGIYTGRSRKEMELARKVLNWGDFPEDMLVSSDDGILKPSPRGLSELCQRAGAKFPLFFGDTASDRETWAAFGRGVFVAIGPILKAEALRTGAPHYDTLESALSELI